MIYTTKEDGKTILWGMSSDDKDDAYDLVTDKNDVVIFRQLDTGKDFVYNDGDWYEFATSGGGGGGGAFFVNGVVNLGEGQISLDKTCGEIKAAYKQGSIVTFNIVNEEGSDYATTVGYLTTIDSGSDFFEINFIVYMGSSISLLYFEASGEDDYAVHTL